MIDTRDGHDQVLSPRGLVSICSWPLEISTLQYKHTKRSISSQDIHGMIASSIETSFRTGQGNVGFVDIIIKVTDGSTLKFF